MKKIFALVALAVASLGAAQIEASYDLTFSIFGKIGESQIRYETQGDRYTITVDAKTTGTAASLSNHRQELYVSKGRIRNGILLPDEYITRKTSDTKSRVKRYLFDHENRVVNVEIDETKKVKSHRFDIDTMSIVDVTKSVEKHKNEQHDFYASNDLISLFFNAKAHVQSLEPGQKTKLSAIGVNTENGEITLTMPDLQEIGRMQQLMPAPTKSDFFKIAVTEEIFDDDEGALMVRLDADSLPHQAMMEGVVMFGDIRAKRTYSRVALNP